VGFAPIDDATTDDKWIIIYAKYNASDMLEEQYSLEGKWSDRVAMFAAY
jgi:hypothetical protein